MIYRIGFSQREIDENLLNKSGFVWKKVRPREEILSLVEKYIDVPYKFGSSVLRDSPNSFDCSSFTSYLYVNAGYSIPRICDDQFRFGREVREGDALPGDLVFFRGDRSDISKDKVGHCGVYIGNGEMIHAGGVDKGYGRVVREKISDSRYYPTGFLGYRRMTEDEEDRFVIDVPEDRIDLRNKETLLQEVKKHVS